MSLVGRVNKRNGVILPLGRLLLQISTQRAPFSWQEKGGGMSFFTNKRNGFPFGPCGVLATDCVVCKIFPGKVWPRSPDVRISV